MGENYALELRDISKSFGSVQANDHVDLTLRKSEILAILGENGRVFQQLQLYVPSVPGFSLFFSACPLNQPLYPLLRVGQKLPELHGNPVSLLPCIGVVCNQSFLLFLQSHIALQHIAGPVKEVIILTLIQLLGE